MKKYILAGALWCLCFWSHAQIKSIELQASGLTCALCTKAINQSLQRLPFVEKVSANIAESRFDIELKPDQPVSPDAIRKAVEDAGFSVAKLELLGQFSAWKVGADRHVMAGNQAYHVLETSSQTPTRMQIVDRKFLSDKAFKQMLKKSNKPCVQTGQSATCCEADGIPPQTRIYHIILSS
jgi:copper chaperone CopZ